MAKKYIEAEFSKQIVPEALNELLQEHTTEIQKTDRLISPPKELIVFAKDFRLLVEEALVNTFALVIAQEVPSMQTKLVEVVNDSTPPQKLEVIFGKKAGKDVAFRESLLMYMGYELSRYARWRSGESYIQLDNGEVTVKNRIQILENIVPGYALSKRQISRRDNYLSIKNLKPYSDDNQLLTHGTYRSTSDIFKSEVLSRHGVIGPVCFSHGCVSLQESEGVFVFEPKVLREAGYPIWLVKENPADADLIQEVRSSLPIPLFLASGFFPDEAFPYDDLSATGAIYADEHHNSCVRGVRALQALQSELEKN